MPSPKTAYRCGCGWTATSFVAVLLVSAVTAGSAMAAPLVSDFNGDGFDDLAIAVPGRMIDGQDAAGAIVIVPGGSFGIEAGAATQFLHRGSEGIPGEPTAGEGWGAVLHTADFDGDGFFDLAIGSPRATVEGEAGRGDVVVLFGSEDGLQLFGVTHLTPDQSLGAAQFGTALAVGAFNGDPFLDLAVGAPGAHDGAGAVIVFEASLIGGFGSGRELRAEMAEIADAARQSEVTSFGIALAAGAFDAPPTGPGGTDLIIAARQSNRGGDAGSNSGRLYVAHGGASPPAGLSLGADFFDLDLDLAPDLVASGNLIALQMIAADFNSDGFADLAAGLPSAGHRQAEGTAARSGAMVTVPGGAEAFNVDAIGLWHQDVPRFSGDVDAGDELAGALAVGDLDDDGFPDLVIAVPGEDLLGDSDRGLFHLLYGSENGLAIERIQTLDHDLELIQVEWGGGAAGDFFAAGLGVGDFNGDGLHDIAIGIPGQDSDEGIADMGAVVVLSGSGRGITTVKSRLVSFETMTALGLEPAAGDFLGASVSGGAADCWFPTFCQRFY